MTCNRYWDVYECRWQDYDGKEQDPAADRAGVPQPRSEAEAPVAAAELGVPVP